MSRRYWSTTIKLCGFFLSFTNKDVFSSKNTTIPACCRLSHCRYPNKAFPQNCMYRYGDTTTCICGAEWCMLFSNTPMTSIDKYIRHNWKGVDVRHLGVMHCFFYVSTCQPGVGVTKAPFVNFSISKILDMTKVHAMFFESHSYLTGVTAAQLRWHLPNINMISNS